MCENTAKFGGGSYIKQRYADLLKPQHIDNRSAEEIAADILSKAGLEVME